MTTLNDFYRVYSIHLRKGDSPHYSLLGSYAVVDGEVHIINDRAGWLEHHVGHGPVTPELQQRLRALKQSHYFLVASLHEIKNGYYPFLAPEAKQDEAPAPEAELDSSVNLDDKKTARPPSIWNFYRKGKATPTRLEIKDGKMYHNGFELSPAAQQVVMRMLDSGEGQLRYFKAPLDPQRLGKAESLLKALIPPAQKEPLPSRPGDEEYDFENLLRGGEVEEAARRAKFDKAWEGIVKANQAGHISDEDFNAMRQERFEDPMSPGIGNKASYISFLNDLKNSRKRYTHIMIDGNDFKSINDLHSHAHGDEAIRMYARAFRRAVDSSPFAKDVKVHRFGGDEYHIALHQPDGESDEQHHQKLHTLMRSLRNETERALPSHGFPELNTTHKLSFSAGVARNPRVADLALNDFAKKNKKAANAPKGQAGFHFYSLIKGKEGTIGGENTPTVPKQHLPSPSSTSPAPLPS